MRRYARAISPERTKVWAEPPPKHHHSHSQQQGRKVPVVYYLCRNRHLDQPHSIEVPLCSPEGLYLRGRKGLILSGEKSLLLFIDVVWFVVCL